MKWMLGLVIVVLLAGCSIEKRHYRGGYYIKWHKRNAGVKNHAKVAKETDTALVVVVKDTIQVIRTEVEEPVVQVPDERHTIPVDSAEVSQEEERVKPADLPKEDRKFEPLGILSSKLLIVDLLLMLLGELSMGPRQYTIFSAVLLGCLIIGFVLGIVSMIRYLRNPRHYKFNIWAILGILVPLVFFILMLIGTATLF